MSVHGLPMSAIFSPSIPCISQYLHSTNDRLCVLASCRRGIYQSNNLFEGQIFEVVSSESRPIIGHEYANTSNQIFVVVS